MIGGKSKQSANNGRGAKDNGAESIAHSKKSKE